MTGYGQDLLERGVELDAISALLARLRGGAGGLLIVEGPAGIGKTALLGTMTDRAAAAGITTLRARGGELERDDPFGVIAQLFGPPLDPGALAGLPVAAVAALGRSAGGAQAPPGEDAARVVYHSLFELCVRLAADAPLLLALDDAHWADERSLRWLVFLARRLDRGPIALALARRPREPGAERDLVDRLAALEDARVIVPAPFSQAATSEVVRDELGANAAEEFCVACQRASAGNPFLLGELLAELRASGVEPNARSASLALSVAPESIARATLLRLARAPTQALPLARALAVLEEGELRDAARLADLDEAEATAAAVALGEAGLLAPGPRLRFAHPLVRGAIYAEIDERERGAQHRRAAQVLRAASASDERVASHLLSSIPVGDERAVQTLRSAARRAYTTGAPDAAARYLRRALDEPPPEGERATVMLELGRAEVRASDPRAVSDLEAAVDLAAAGPPRARALRELARGHMLAGRMDEAGEAFERAVGQAESDTELALALEGELAATLANLTSAQEAAARLAPYREVPGETPAQRTVLALLAFAALQRGEAASVALELIERALRDGSFVSEQTAGTIVFADGIFTLILAGRERRALELLRIAEADAARLGWSITLIAAPFFQGYALLRLGQLEAARERIGAALTVSADRGWQAYTPMAAAILCELELERGDPGAAAGALEAIGLPEDVPESALFQLALYARGHLRALRGETEAALTDILLCGERELGLGGVTPAALAWRSDAALLHHALGNERPARALAQEELGLARALGTPRAIGIALRARALVAGGDTVAGLREAVETLSVSDAPLEHARALTDLGAALRRSGQRREARGPLREALSFADAAGAGQIAARARAELLATGARPRRAALRGLESLTASERRVAELAASGRANREIASELVVTVRTVEFHLSRAYAKLGIDSRRELAAAIPAQPPP